MNFTQDWFTNNIPNFQKCMEQIGDERGNFLEIGSYEGRSTCWLMQNGLAEDGTIICIDPFTDAKGFQNLDLIERFEDNTFKAKKKNQYLRLMQTASYYALAEIIGEHEDQFDFVYIDGNHRPDFVLTDACMVWDIVRPGGVILFDDYEYPEEPTKKGIDAFLTCFDGQYDMVLKNYQLAVRKK